MSIKNVDNSKKTRKIHPLNVDNFVDMLITFAKNRHFLKNPFSCG